MNGVKFTPKDNRRVRFLIIKYKIKNDVFHIVCKTCKITNMKTTVTALNEM